MGGEGHQELADASIFQRAKSDAEISAEALAHREEQDRIAALQPVMDLDTARAFLTRKGRKIVCASVYGGSSLRFIVSGFGEDEISAEQLIKEAERVRDRRPREEVPA